MAINNLIVIAFEKFKAKLPHFIQEFIPLVQNFIRNSKNKFFEKFPHALGLIKVYLEHTKQKITASLGFFTGILIFFRSEEFKSNKFIIFKKSIDYCKNNPQTILTFSALLFFFTFSTYLVFLNTQKIVTGTKKMRAPASALQEELVNENLIELHNMKFEVLLKGPMEPKAAPAGGGNKEVNVVFDIKIEATSKDNKELLEDMEEKLNVELEAFSFTISSLPVSPEELKKNEKALIKYLNHEFAHNNNENIVKKVSLIQTPEKRPVYFLQKDRQYSMKDLVLQIFLEDTHRNRQVMFDYSVLASNRNVILYLKDNEYKIRDKLSTEVEPVIPRLPLEEEGRGIIKDKIRYELNELLKADRIEGTVLEVYIDYILTS
jgi:hypothetical protein